jgi:metal-responsive CopG/Arc/MetJ family transcriptional regulator
MVLRDHGMLKVAISLPDEVFKSIERECLAAGETRSEFISRVVETYFRNKRQKEAVEQYIQDYQKFPETAEDLVGLQELTLAAWAEVPWEE